MLICFEFNLASVICMLIKKKTLGKAEKNKREKQEFHIVCTPK